MKGLHICQKGYEFKSKASIIYNFKSFLKEISNVRKHSMQKCLKNPIGKLALTSWASKTENTHK